MTSAIEVKNIVKSYIDKKAVDDLSFSVDCGEIFGLIGPNGAGKTTTIRMMMDIIEPDSGTVSVLGEKLCEKTKDRLGYLPEERGLYKKQKVIDSILYFASLKGMNRTAALARADELLAKTGMSSVRNKKVEELSKGMSQLIQFVVTVIHDPELLVLDEPFSGLDPVNTELLKSLTQEMRSRGKAIIFSTHQMNQVEELCDRVLMVDHGRSVLYGSLAQIKSKYRGDSVLVEVEGEMGEVPGVTKYAPRKNSTELTLAKGTTPQALLASLVSRGLIVNRFEIATPSLNEIFISLAGKKHE